MESEEDSTRRKGGQKAMWQQNIHPLDDKEILNYNGPHPPDKSLHFSLGTDSRYAYLTGTYDKEMRYNVDDQAVLHVFDLWKGEGCNYSMRNQKGFVDKNIRHLYEMHNGYSIMIIQNQKLKIMVVAAMIDHENKTIICSPQPIYAIEKKHADDTWSSARNDNGVTLVLNNSGDNRHLLIAEFSLNGETRTSVITEPLNVAGQPWQQGRSLKYFEQAIAENGRRFYTGRIFVIDLDTTQTRYEQLDGFPFCIGGDQRLKMKHVGRGDKVWVVTDDDPQPIINNKGRVNVWRINNGKWFHVTKVDSNMSNVTLDVREDESAILLEKAAHPDGHAIVRRMGLLYVGRVGSLLGIAKTKALQHHKWLRRDTAIRKIVGA